MGWKLLYAIAWTWVGVSFDMAPRMTFWLFLAGVALTGLCIVRAERFGNNSVENEELLGALLDAPVFSPHMSDVSSCLSRYVSNKVPHPFDLSLERSYLPGAEEWCDCLVRERAKITPILSPNDRDLVRITATCKEQILDKLHAPDVQLFCSAFASAYHDRIFSVDRITFCGNACSNAPPDGFLYGSCSDSCVNDMMPTYCSTNRLSYSPWSIANFPLVRTISVDSTAVAIQRIGEPYSVEALRGKAEIICSKLHPDEPDRCCTHPKGNIFSSCCYERAPGDFRFDCDNPNAFRGASIFNLCQPTIEMDRQLFPNEFCYSFRDAYLEVGNPQEMELIAAKDNDVKVASISDLVVRETCAKIPSIDGLAACCNYVEKYLQPFLLEKPSLCSCNSLEETCDNECFAAYNPSVCSDRCKGLCQDGEQCTVTKRGRALCIQCDHYKVDLEGRTTDCCTSAEGKCVPALQSDGTPVSCSTWDKAVYYLSDDGAEKLTPTFVNKTERNVCGKPYGFRKHKGACVVRRDAEGRFVCV